MTVMHEHTRLPSIADSKTNKSLFFFFFFPSAIYYMMIFQLLKFKLCLSRKKGVFSTAMRNS